MLNAFSISRRGIQDGGDFYIVKDSSLVKHNATIEHVSDNGIILTNLNDGDLIVIEPISSVKSSQKIGTLIQQ